MSWLEESWGLTSVALRGSLTDVRGADRPGSAGGVTIAVEGEHFGLTDVWSGYSKLRMGIGGGTGGFEGALAGDVLMGWRAPVSAHHGPVFRVGMGGELTGNQRLYFSRLELPVAQLGYQYAEARTLLELGARGGPILTGRYNVGNDASRDLGTSLEWGAYAAAHTAHTRLSVSVMRIEARDTFPDTPVDVGRGTFCVYPGAMALCLDGSIFRGDVTWAIPLAQDQATSVYAGLSLGLFEPVKKPPKPKRPRPRHPHHARLPLAGVLPLPL